jgi:hypothetical protein
MHEFSSCSQPDPTLSKRRFLDLWRVSFSSSQRTVTGILYWEGLQLSWNCYVSHNQFSCIAWCRENVMNALYLSLLVLVVRTITISSTSLFVFENHRCRGRGRPVAVSIGLVSWERKKDKVSIAKSIRWARVTKKGRKKVKSDVAVSIGLIR